MCGHDSCVTGKAVQFHAGTVNKNANSGPNIDQIITYISWKLNVSRLNCL